MRTEKKKGLDHEFLIYYLNSSIPSMRWGLGVNLSLFILFALFNRIFFPDMPEQQYFLRFGLILPFFLLSIIILYIPKLKPWLIPLFVCINAGLGLLIFLIGVTTEPGEKGYEYYFVWVILMTIGLFTFYRLRFSTLLILGGLQISGFILAISLNGSFTYDLYHTLNNLFFVIAAAALGFFIAYTIQQLNRKTFLHQKALDHQYQKLLVEYQEKTSLMKELEQAAEQKDLMMKEIHHRVKNNLAIVISMLSLQMRSNTDPRLRQLLTDVEMRIRSMALVHEHLYRSEDLNNIHLDQYLYALSTIVVSTYHTGGITLTHELEPMDASIGTALPVGLITNELLTNALKYAFKHQPEKSITIRLISREDHFILEVSDNGIGLPEPFHPEEMTTLGIFIVNLLVQQTGGTLTTHNEPGATFRITFPINREETPFTI